jgi:hypothetical protein
MFKWNFQPLFIPINITSIFQTAAVNMQKPLLTAPQARYFNMPTYHAGFFQDFQLAGFNRMTGVQAKLGAIGDLIICGFGVLQVCWG